MEKTILSAIISLVILIALMFIIPDDNALDSELAKTVNLQRHASDLMNVKDVHLTPEGVLQISYVDDTGLTTSHHFINLKSRNVILVEDEEFEPERIQISDIAHGGLKITIAKSLKLMLP